MNMDLITGPIADLAIVSPNTGDLGLAVSIGGIVIAAIFFIFLKKR